MVLGLECITVYGFGLRVYHCVSLCMVLGLECITVYGFGFVTNGNKLRNK